MKIAFVLIFALFLAGCNTLGFNREPRTETVYQEVKVPVSNVPMPPNTDCPDIAVDTISTTDAEDDGLLAKAYRISIEQLRDCAKLRQKVLDKYRDIAEEDAENIKNVPASAANPNGPFGSSGPVAPSSNNGSPTPSNGSAVPQSELIRQMRIENDFSNLEEEFEELKEKDYDVE